MRLPPALAAVCAVTVAARYIVPGARWRDTDGNLVNAHAGSVSFDEVSSKFWWFGEYKVEGQEEGGGVSVYSSKDLATWEHHGLALGKWVETSSSSSSSSWRQRMMKIQRHVANARHRTGGRPPVHLA